MLQTFCMVIQCDVSLSTLWCEIIKESRFIFTSAFKTKDVIKYAETSKRKVSVGTRFESRGTCGIKFAF